MAASVARNWAPNPVTTIAAIPAKNTATTVSNAFNGTPNLALIFATKLEITPEVTAATTPSAATKADTKIAIATPIVPLLLIIPSQADVSTQVAVAANRISKMRET